MSNPASADPFRRLRLALRFGCPGSGLMPTLLGSRIDVHPHQVEAALFALSRPLSRGAILADEVGLGKTVEAGLVIAQALAQGAQRVLVLVPASLRVQWQSELKRFFAIDAQVVDLPLLRRLRSRFTSLGVCISSYAFFSNDTNPPDFREADWDLVVLDEAHRLRNVYQAGARRARRLRSLLHGKRKLLLTATPIQNSLLELYGLVSFVDDKLLGSEASFRSRFLADDRGLEARNTEELRERLGSVVIRTLRRQVRERIQFTNRTSLLFDFEPTPAELDLYSRLSEFLGRAKAIQVAFGNRELFLLLCRKILASSTFAVAGTLRRMVVTLTERLSGNLGSIELNDEIDGFEDEVEELGQGRRSERWSAGDIEKEIAELRFYAAFAESIKVNAKGERLIAALQQVFAHARERGWPEKAVIFTESRRTLAYLHHRLQVAGHSGKVTELHGGSGDAVARDALVREFRDRTRILLTTEVGAEGLNLQFCNIVVNYDLPWNPQRIEQRIGRCHRYGQKLDVLVVNFLNTANAADCRLFELLSAKLKLFDGLFGSSDEVLGTMESGVGFERRVLDIYLRSDPKEVEAGFRKLERELDAAVNQDLSGSARSLLDSFDDEVRERLAHRADSLESEIGLLRADLERLVLGAATKTSPEGDDCHQVEFPPAVVAALRVEAVPSRVRFDSGPGAEPIGPDHPLVGAIAEFVRQAEGPPRVHELMLETHGQDTLKPLAGRRGFWLSYEVTVRSDGEKRHQVDLAVLEEGEVLDDGQVAALDGCRSKHLGYAAVELPPRLAEAVAPQLLDRVADLVAGAGHRADRLVADERRRLERFSTETLNEARRQVQRARDASLRTAAKLKDLERDRSADPAAEREARALVDLFEGQLRHEERLLAEDQRRQERDAVRALQELSERLQVSHSQRLAGIARFWLV